MVIKDREASAQEQYEMTVLYGVVANATPPKERNQWNSIILSSVHPKLGNAQTFEIYQFHFKPTKEIYPGRRENSSLFVKSIERKERAQNNSAGTSLDINDISGENKSGNKPEKVRDSARKRLVIQPESHKLIGPRSWHRWMREIHNFYFITGLSHICLGQAKTKTEIHECQREMVRCS